MLVRLPQPAHQPVRPRLTLGALIGGQQVDVGHGVEPVDALVVAAVAAAVAVHQSPVVGTRSVAQTGLSQANDGRGQRQDRREGAESDEHRVDDDGSLSERHRPEKVHSFALLLKITSVR